MDGTDPNFTQKCPIGTVVVRSRYWNKQHNDRQKGQLGIVMHHELHKEEEKLVYYTTVFWEGAVMPSLTHAANFSLYRKKDQQKARRYPGCWKP